MSMREIDKRTRLSRRGFLAVGSATTVAVGALAGGGILIDPRGVWAVGLQVLKPDTAGTLIRMARDLYPHDRLGDSYYAKAVETMDAAAAKSPESVELLTRGAAALNEAARAKSGKPYADIAAEGDRVALLKSIEPTPFFKKVRGDMITALYNQPEVWTKLGYEGPSAPEGGYLHRGFDDIDWLKDA
jgi:hypothetical protein